MIIDLNFWDLLYVETILFYNAKHLLSMDIRWKNPEKFLLIFNLGYRNCGWFFRFLNKYYRKIKI